MSEQVLSDVPLRELLAKSDPTLNYRVFNNIVAMALRDGVVTKEELTNKFKISIPDELWSRDAHLGPAVRALIYLYIVGKVEPRHNS